MKFIDWFAGIGGFRAGMELAGHECIGFCEYDKFAVMGYKAMHLTTKYEKERLLKLNDYKKGQEYINGIDFTDREWYANDVRKVEARSVPRADCWCFGFPCQDISVAGKQLGFDGKRSSLFFTVTRIIRDTKEEDRPSILFIENVKNLLSVNGGSDFLKLQIELDEIGYDAEWQVINSKHYGVPQNRERVFIIGHLRGRSRREVFPIEESDGENCIHTIGTIYPNRSTNGRIYGTDGISGCLDCMGGGNRQPMIAVNLIGNVNPSGNGMNGNVFDSTGLSPTLTTNKGEGNKIAIPVLTPDRAEKRQNGRRFKENGEPMFTLTSQDRHGVGIKVKEATKQGYAIAHEGDSINLSVPGSDTRRGRVGKGVANTLDTKCNQGIMVQVSESLTVYAIWSEKYQCYIAIQKLTPKECFRLQGWTDVYFELAASVNSDSQLYKQAGNGVTVNVIYEIAKRL